MRVQNTNARAAQPPSLLVFYHIPKTGGSSTREWLLRNAGLRSRGLPKRMDGLVRYYEASCFFCLQLADAIGVGNTATCAESFRRKCTMEYKPRPAAFDFTKAGAWKSGGSLAVEFHGPSEGTFINFVLPHAQILRELYARHSGTCKFATLLRDPIDFLFSSYHMWPPRPLAAMAKRERSQQHKERWERLHSTSAASNSTHDTLTDDAPVTPFPRWVQGAQGLQAAFLTSPQCVSITRAEGHRNTCGRCNASSRHAAISVLRHFDVIGLTSCLPNFFDGVELAMGLFPPDSASAKLRRRSKGGNATAGLLKATPKCSDCSAQEDAAHAHWTWESLTSAQRHVTREVAGCDQALYRAALLRMRFESTRARLTLRPLEHTAGVEPLLPAPTGTVSSCNPRERAPS